MKRLEEIIQKHGSMRPKTTPFGVVAYVSGHCGGRAVIWAYCIPEELIEIAKKLAEEINEERRMQAQDTCPHCGLEDTLQWGRVIVIVGEEWDDELYADAVEYAQ